MNGFNSGNKQGKLIFTITLVLLSIILSLQTFAAKDFIVENKTAALFIINGTTGNIILAPSFGLVGIGTINPINALTIIGSVTSFGSLNATFINATEIRIGNNLIGTSGAFNNGNYTTLEDSAFRIVNFTTQLNNYISSFFNNENFTNLKPFTITNYSAEYASTGFKIINFTNNYDNRADRFGNANYSNLAPFTLANYSSEYGSSGFKIANYTALENAAFTNANYTNLNTSLWNLSRNLFVYLKDAAFLVRIGDVNRNISNDTFAVIGSAAVYGSLNSTSFNSSFILQNNNQVQTINAVFNNVNYTSLENAAFTNTNYTNLEAVAFNKVNYSAEYASTGFKNANYTSLEDAAFRIANFTANYEAQAYFKIANYTALQNAAFTLANYSAEYASTGYKLANFTSNLNAQNGSLWNRSSASTYLKFIDDLVGIGTITPDNRLTIRGTDADANLAGQPGLLHLNITDSYNKSTTNLITLDHNLNNPANSTGGIGIGILFRAINNDSELVNVSFINASLVNAINGSEASALSFYTRAANGLLTPKLILNGSDVFIAPTGGNVGIGTTAPGFLFEVSGVATTLANIKSSGDDTRLRLENTGTGGKKWSLISAGTSSGLPTSGFAIKQTTDGLVRLVIDDSGNVGIGTTGPDSALHVNSSSVGGALKITNGSGSNYTSLFVNASSGFIGIGTAGPISKLHIADTSSAASPALRMTGSNSGDLVYLGDLSGASENVGGLVLYNDSGSQSIKFQAAGSLNSWINTGGNVGIGTTVPGTKLTVVGDANISGSLNVSSGLNVISGNVGIGTTAPQNKLNIWGSSAGEFIGTKITNANGGLNSAGTLSFALTSADVDMATIKAIRTNAVTDADTDLAFSVYNNSALTERVRIQSSGNVGIGTTGPTSMLHLNSTTNYLMNFDGPSNKWREIEFSNSGNVIAQIGKVAAGNNNVYIVGNGTSNLLLLNTGGNVGIGTTVPGQKLTVVGDANVSGSLNVSDSLNVINGNVGIGTTGPAAKLHIEGTDNVISQLKSTGADSNVRLYLANDAQNWALFTSGTQNDIFKIRDMTGAAGDAFVIATSGNVGIGTTGPEQPLHIKSTADALILERTSTVFSTVWGQDNIGTVNYSYFRANSSAHSMGYIFSTDNTPATSPQVVINPDGNVGIGTTSPAVVLDVKGKANFTGNFSVGQTSNIFFVDNTTGNVGIGTTGPGALLDVFQGSATTYGRVGRFVNNNFATFDIGFSSALTNLVSNNAIAFHTGSSLGTPGSIIPSGERVRIDTSGNVGIGTTTPDNILAVKGSGIGNGIIITHNVAAASNWTLKSGIAGVNHAYFAIGNGTSNILTITPTMQVGINNTSPSSNLDIVGTISVSTGSGTQGLFQSTTGNVGIGTTAPGQKLDVAGNVQIGSGNYLFIGAGETRFGGDTSNAIIYSNNAERMRINSNGNVGIANTNPEETLSVTGNLSISGTNCKDSGGSATCNNFVDFAELFDSSEPVESGDIVVIDFIDSSSLAQPNSPQNPKSTHNSFQNPRPEQSNNQQPAPLPLTFNTENNPETSSSFKVKKSTKPYDSKVIGIVSTQPAIVIEGGRIVAMGGTTYQNNTLKPAIALAGRVPVKVSTESGNIKPGDRITSSSQSGIGMKAAAYGPTVGIAMESFDGSNEQCGSYKCGKIIVFVNVGEGNVAQKLTAQEKQIEELQANNNYLTQRLDKIENKIMVMVK